MREVFEIIIIILISYVIYSTNIKEILKNKRIIDKSIKEGNFKKGIIRGSNILYFMIISSLIINMIILYICKVKYSFFMIIWGTVAAFVFESMVVLIVGGIRGVVRSYKQDGILNTIIAIIITIFGIVGYLYVKYNW